MDLENVTRRGPAGSRSTTPVRASFMCMILALSSAVVCAETQRENALLLDPTTRDEHAREREWIGDDAYFFAVPPGASARVALRFAVDRAGADVLIPRGAGQGIWLPSLRRATSEELARQDQPGEFRPFDALTATQACTGTTLSIETGEAGEPADLLTSRLVIRDAAGGYLKSFALLRHHQPARVTERGHPDHALGVASRLEVPLETVATTAVAAVAGCYFAVKVDDGVMFFDALAATPLGRFAVNERADVRHGLIAVPGERMEQVRHEFEREFPALAAAGSQDDALQSRLWYYARSLFPSGNELVELDPHREMFGPRLHAWFNYPPPHTSFFINEAWLAPPRVSLPPLELIRNAGRYLLAVKSGDGAPEYSPTGGAWISIFDRDGNLLNDIYFKSKGHGTGWISSRDDPEHDGHLKWVVVGALVTPPGRDQRQEPWEDVVAQYDQSVEEWLVQLYVMNDAGVLEEKRGPRWASYFRPIAETFCPFARADEPDPPYDPSTASNAEYDLFERSAMPCLSALAGTEDRALILQSLDRLQEYPRTHWPFADIAPILRLRGYAHTDIIANFSGANQ